MKRKIVDILVELGRRMEALPEDVVARIVTGNQWFTAAEVRRAAHALASDMLAREPLEKWLARYPALPVAEPRNALVIMAGNIPFVGMQDLICVLAAGHNAVVKPSSKDYVSIYWVVSQLLDIAPGAAVSVLNENSPMPDAVIAMGSNETVAAIGRKYTSQPVLMRGSRSSMAILDGSETAEELAALADDVLSFSGLGCRNVSLVFVPREYDFYMLRSAVSERVEHVHIKYRNNYRQARALMSMNDESYTDCGGCILRENSNFSSDVSILNYVFYDCLSDVKDYIKNHDPEIQCIVAGQQVSDTLSHPRAVNFGATQRPRLWDYPDGRDTMQFLESIGSKTALERTLVMIVGPTGSGKTDFAIDLAARLNAPVISTDSRQVYRGMAVGTAQPTEDQLNTAKHYFIADREPTERFSCADFEKEALSLLEKLYEKHDFVVAVGGSGLYIDALCSGLDALPDIDIEIRSTLKDRLIQEGLNPLLQLLKDKDPDYYERVDRRNPARVLRALEVCLQTGKPFSEFRTGKVAKRPFRIVKIGIEIARKALYERIDLRVDAMMKAGLEEEARKLYRLRDLPALQTLGYREIFDHMDGKTSLEEAVELIKRNSRRYAKRQMTWFRRDPEIRWVDPQETDVSDILGDDGRSHSCAGRLRICRRL